MNKFRVLLPFIAWSCLCPVRQAVAETLIVPRGNIGCSLKITYHSEKIAPSAAGTPPPAPAANSALPKKVEISRTEKLLYIDITRANNSTVRAWCPGVLNLTLFKDSSKNQINSLRGSYLFPPIFYLDRNPVWYSWVKEGNFKEELTYLGVRCRRYQENVRIPSPSPGAPDWQAVYQIWVNSETLAPVAFDDGEALYEIAFHSFPASPPSLPDEALKEIGRYEELLAPPKPANPER